MRPSIRTAWRRAIRSQAFCRREDRAAAEKALRAAAHRTLRTVTDEYAELRFNTMVAHLMELSNLLQRYRGTEIAGGRLDEAVRLLLLMLAPAAPHIAEELWSRISEARREAGSSIHTQAWPDVDEAAAAENERECRSR